MLRHGQLTPVVLSVDSCECSDSFEAYQALTSASKVVSVGTSTELVKRRIDDAFVSCLKMRELKGFRDSDLVERLDFACSCYLM